MQRSAGKLGEPQADDAIHDGIMALPVAGGAIVACGSAPVLCTMSGDALYSASRSWQALNAELTTLERDVDARTRAPPRSWRREAAAAV